MYRQPRPQRVDGRLPRVKKTGRPKKYNPPSVAVLRAVWELFDFQCGKLLAPLIRGMMGYLVIEFNLSEVLQALLTSVSPAVIDRKLRKAKERYRLKGIHTTKPGNLLKSRIPVKVCLTGTSESPDISNLTPSATAGRWLPAGFARR